MIEGVQCDKHAFFQKRKYSYLMGGGGSEISGVRKDGVNSMLCVCQKIKNVFDGNMGLKKTK